MICKTGARLYYNWTRLVPQIKSNDWASVYKMKYRTAESEKARRAYESHFSSCSICNRESTKAIERLARDGI